MLSAKGNTALCRVISDIVLWWQIGSFFSVNSADFLFHFEIFPNTSIAFCLAMSPLLFLTVFSLFLHLAFFFCVYWTPWSESACVFSASCKKPTEGSNSHNGCCLWLFCACHSALANEMLSWSLQAKRDLVWFRWMERDWTGSTDVWDES